MRFKHIALVLTVAAAAGCGPGGNYKGGKGHGGPGAGMPPPEVSAMTVALQSLPETF